MRKGILYVEAAGDLVRSFDFWRKDIPFPSESGKTFSSQLFDYCKESGQRLYGFSYNENRKRIESDLFVVENVASRQYKSTGDYMFMLLMRTFFLFRRVYQLKPRYLVVNSGVVLWHQLIIFKLLGVKIIPSLHNTLWPKGVRPKGILQRILLAMDAVFFKYIADATICVSGECKRQIEEVTRGGGHGAIFSHIPQFYQDDFIVEKQLDPTLNKPFRIMYAGRIEQNKGVFDILTMASSLIERGYTDFLFDICGDGSDIELLNNLITSHELTRHVHVLGRLDKKDLLKIYNQSHIVIVPTKSTFSEGFAMVAAEAMLLGKPVVCSSIVPAAEYLDGAVLVVDVDDVEGFTSAVVMLMTNGDVYQKMCSQCELLRNNFFSDEFSLKTAISSAISSIDIDM